MWLLQSGKIFEEAMETSSRRFRKYFRVTKRHNNEAEHPTFQQLIKQAPRPALGMGFPKKFCISVATAATRGAWKPFPGQKNRTPPPAPSSPPGRLQGRAPAALGGERPRFGERTSPAGPALKNLPALKDRLPRAGAPRPAVTAVRRREGARAGRPLALFGVSGKLEK